MMSGKSETDNTVLNVINAPWLAVCVLVRHEGPRCSRFVVGWMDRQQSERIGMFYVPYLEHFRNA